MPVTVIIGGLTCTLLRHVRGLTLSMRLKWCTGLAWQDELSGKGPAKQHAKKKKGFMGTLVGFALGTDG